MKQFNILMKFKMKKKSVYKNKMIITSGADRFIYELRI